MKLDARHNSPRQRPLRPTLSQSEHPLIHLGPLELPRLPLLERRMNLPLVDIQPTRQRTQRQLGIARTLRTLSCDSSAPSVTSEIPEARLTAF